MCLLHIDLHVHKYICTFKHNISIYLYLYIHTYLHKHIDMFYYTRHGHTNNQIQMCIRKRMRPHPLTQRSCASSMYDTYIHVYLHRSRNFSFTAAEGEVFGQSDSYVYSRE